tara:strand:- start:5722 stop:6477 length:756 start_codon:yes stop_codon:yes gene_type:complete
MKVLVIGGAGWLGRAILGALDGHHEVVAFDLNDEAWERGNRIDGPWEGGTIVHGDVSDFDAVDKAVKGVDRVIHVAMHSTPGAYHEHDDLPFLVNLKGLWNTLESARRHGIPRVVHIGSCHVENPKGVFFDAEVRRPDGALYAVTKRLQEEMCRQFHDAFGLSQVVFRPCSIIDSRIAQVKGEKDLERGTWEMGWVCRHDIGNACRAAIEKEGIDFEILHVAGHPDADKHCNVGRTRELLSVEFTSKLAGD